LRRLVTCEAMPAALQPMSFRPPWMRSPRRPEPVLLRELIEALVEHEVTRDSTMLNHVYNTLVISHQLHQQPGYAESAAAARALDPEDTVDVADYLASRHGRGQNPA
jgi:hypothetical protein